VDLNTKFAGYFTLLRLRRLVFLIDPPNNIITMAKDLSSNSTNYYQLQKLSDRNSKTSVLASCYSVDASSMMLHGFHYCTTLGPGSQWYP
jgi:hypothetical protein